MVDGPTLIGGDGTERPGFTVPAGAGYNFKLEPTDLTRISVSHQTTLEFELLAVVIEATFELQRGGSTYRLDPGRRTDLGPLLDLYPDRLLTMEAAGDGTLELEFASGARILVPPSAEPYEPWEVRGPGDALVVCTAGGAGQLAVWSKAPPPVKPA
jgi:hypothetical protein